VRRFLQSHALIGLDDLTARYPLDPGTATALLERWAGDWDLVRLEADEEGTQRWADRRNLDEVRRLSVALARRESIAVLPEVFTEFVARRQHAHAETRREGAAAVALALEQLQGFAAPADLWESEILPRRIRDFRPSWLDEAMASCEWYWRAEGEVRGEPRVAIVPREFAGHWPAPESMAELSEIEQRVHDEIIRRGALYVDEIARGTGVEPSLVRASLASLAKQGLLTNDRLDPLRAGADAVGKALAHASAQTAGRAARPRLGSFRRLGSNRLEGRWFVPPMPDADSETALLAWSAALLERYGVLARETAALDPWAPPWRELAPVLGRAELRGEVRRGYFVEGLSGVQYALSETADELARLAGRPLAATQGTLLSTLDPANLYGSGAPLDIPLLEGGTARLTRSTSNFLVLFAGRPVLIIESFGRRLTGLASSSESELRAALALLPTLCGPARRVLRVETYNTAATLASPAAPWLAELGFVRDPPGMAYYAGW
jgi:ATP-dependent Lhr-like helicase